MNHNTLAIQLKAVIIGVAVFGLMVYLWIVPALGHNIAEMFPECAYAYRPWLIFIWATGIPCYTALVFAWKIATNIGRDHSFCRDNGILMKRIAKLATGDGIFFFLGNIVLLFAGINHPGIVIVSVFVTCIAMGISVAASALSHLIMEAAELQEQSDFTI
jgi:hypothetical protein